MSVYVVTWNLNKEGAAYQQARTTFLNQLGAYENTKDSGLETVRWISTNQTADQVSAHLRQKLDDNDRLFVSKVSSGSHQGWLSKTTWDWINSRL
jgi:hypothetical protein